MGCALRRRRAAASAGGEGGCGAEGPSASLYATPEMLRLLASAPMASAFEQDVRELEREFGVRVLRGACSLLWRGAVGRHARALGEPCGTCCASTSRRRRLRRPLHP
ncbi:unnamed protein product, partial [Prorocentrum cordatum]